MLRRLTILMIGSLIALAPSATTPGTEPVASVTVSAQSRVQVEAEVIEIGATVVTRAKTLDDLQKSIESKGQALVSYARAFGLAEEDIVVLSTSTSQNYGKEDENVEATSFDASRGYSFTLRQIPRYVEFISGLMKNGARLASAPRMRCADEKKHRDKAYTDAMALARDKAQLLAAASGQHLGKAIKIEAEESDYDMLNFYYNGGGSGNSSSSTTRIQKVPIGAKVTVTYALEQ
jgi:uncharacterized protein